MNIVAWGDSITFGAGDSEALGWPGRLQLSLLETEDANVYNRGICGDTSLGVLDRFDVEAKSLNPKKIFFAFGMNDCKFPSRGDTTKIPLEDYRSNIVKLISKARKFTEEIIIIGITEVKSEDIGGTTLFTNHSVYEFDNTLREIAAEERLPYIDMRGVLDLENDLSDGLHPNNVGYEKMFQKLKDELLLSQKEKF